MTTIEICNSYQMSIAVMQFSASMLDATVRKESSFWLFFFSVKEVPFLKVRLRTEDVCKYHFLLSIYSSIQYFFSRYDKFNMIRITFST